jgi:hypothetical protein
LSVEAPVQEGHYWWINFSCNSKNLVGGYIGIQRNRVAVANNQIDWPTQKTDAFWRGFQKGMAE